MTRMVPVPHIVGREIKAAPKEFSFPGADVRVGRMCSHGCTGWVNF